MNASHGNMVIADGLGEFLRRERELRHISLDDVAERTKISRRYLEAIEEEQFDRLPGETFIRGFIRSYAQSVGLDPADTLLIYSQSRMVHEAPSLRTARTPPVRRAWNERSWLWLFMVGVVIIAGVLVSVLGFLAWPTLLGSTSAPRPDPVNPAVGNAPLILTAIADSDTWLWVTIDEQEPQDMVLRGGQAAKWMGRERFVVSIGNARTTRLKLNGRELTMPQPAQSTLRGYIVSRDLLP